MSRAAEQRSERRAQILTIAKQVFAELGYHNASISEIIERAGIARGTFYLYFDSKHAVFDAILSEALEQLAQKIRPISLAPGSASPRHQLQKSLQAVLAYLLGDQALTQLLLNHGLTPDAQSAARVDAFYQRATALIEASLRHGIQMGLIRPCDTTLAAAGLFGTIRGITAQLCRSSESSIEHAVDEVMKLALHGVVLGSGSWDRQTEDCQTED